jgi:hypothetical protein
MGQAQQAAPTLSLPYESPTLPTEGSMPASARSSVYLMER